jgi:hypothetical protein
MPFLDRIYALFSSLTADALIAALAVALVGALALIIHLEWRLARLTRGRDAASLEETIRALSASAEESKAFRADMERYLTGVEKRLRRSLQRVETIRFNPFQGTGGGGNQSFASAFISEDGDGVVFSSIYARERMSMFAKPLSKRTSTFELTEEEKKVIEQASVALSAREEERMPKK